MSEQAKKQVQVERGRKRVRTYLNGELVADTYAPLLVWEIPYYPTYYLSAADLKAELIPAGESEHKAGLGDGEILHIKTKAGPGAGAARRYSTSPIAELHDAVRIEWAAMDEWLEEDEPVYTHPRDPYHRVDILASSRHVRVEVDGATVADCARPVILFETGLPPRYYLPLPDVRTDLLTPSGTQTHCPYKGTATYWSVDTGHGTRPDLVWSYRAPLPESQKIAGLACFYDEKADVYLDGELQE